jgi:hypothetical protein
MPFNFQWSINRLPPMGKSPHLRASRCEAPVFDLKSILACKLAYNSGSA